MLDVSWVHRREAGMADRQTTVYNCSRKLPGGLPQLSVDKELLQRLALTEQEYRRIVGLTRKEPNRLELSIFAALWSEHCAYKHSRPLLKKYFGLFETQEFLFQSHENAGAVRIDEDNWVVMKVESHNHPSAVEPYQGAATGIGGIVRDILTLGARPIALLNSLRFGELNDQKTRHLFNGVTSGIAGYGNCLGIPDVGGEIFFSKAYNGTPLVNVMCVGIFKPSESKLKWHERNQQREQLYNPFTPRSLPGPKQRPAGSVLVLFGSDTGRDGIQGAAFASSALSDTGEDQRPAVQIGDPFKEKLLLEACLDLSRLGCLEGFQDLGAAGLSGAAIEYAARRGLGVEIDVSAVPRREMGMNAEEVMVSESQERMLVSVKEGREGDVKEVLDKWGLACSVVGRLTPRQEGEAYEVVIRDGSQKRALARIKRSAITNSPVYSRTAVPSEEAQELAPAWPIDWIPSGCTGALSDEAQELRDFDLSSLLLPSLSPNHMLLTLLRTPNIASKESVYRQYDHQVQTNTVVGPGSDAAVLRVKGTGKAIALCLDGNGRYCYLDPYVGGVIAVAEACRNVVCSGAKPLAVTDCLNFGDPRRPEVYYQLEEAIKGIADACNAFQIPVISGNVSLYNETKGGAVYPTPVVGVLGLVEDVQFHVTSAFKRASLLVVLLGANRLQSDVSDLAGSEYLEVVHGRVAGRPAIDLALEVRTQALCRRAIGEGIVASAHDCSDGGLAVALGECCIQGGVGFRASEGLSNLPARWDVALFGERQSRIVVSLPPEKMPRLGALAAELGVPILELGVTGGHRFQLGRYLDLPLQDLADAWGNGLERALAG